MLFVVRLTYQPIMGVNRVIRLCSSFSNMFVSYSIGNICVRNGYIDVLHTIFIYLSIVPCHVPYTWPLYDTWFTQCSLLVNNTSMILVGTCSLCQLLLCCVMGQLRVMTSPIEWDGTHSSWDTVVVPTCVVLCANVHISVVPTYIIIFLT